MGIRVCGIQTDVLSIRGARRRGSDYFTLCIPETRRKGGGLGEGGPAIAGGLKHLDNGKCSGKTKRPRLDLSRGTFVDQPSPKCCSRTRVRLGEREENGT
jgi:hypothetical protein